MTSRTRRLGPLGLPALLLAAACGPTPGTINVHLMDAPADFKEINLHILTLEAHSNTTGWVALSHPDKTVDILALTGGVVETLASGVALEPGKYTQFRFVLGDGNTVRLKDDTLHDLTVPSGLQSGVKLVCHVDVKAGETRDVFIDIDGRHSIFLHGTGLPEKFILRPVIKCFQGPATPETPPVETTGTISGQLNALGPTESLMPLAGVTVTAQVLDAAGKASIVDSTTTDGLGNYTLDNLPLGATYYVVSQPVMGTGLATQSWDAQASLATPLDATHATASFTALFGSAAVTGSVDGTISAAATNAGDVVFARQTLHPADPITVIVRTQEVVVSGSSETFAIASLPLGSYSLSAIRPGGLSSSSVPVVLTAAGVAVPATLVFP